MTNTGNASSSSGDHVTGTAASPFGIRFTTIIVMVFVLCSVARGTACGATHIAEGLEFVLSQNGQGYSMCHNAEACTDTAKLLSPPTTLLGLTTNALLTVYQATISSQDYAVCKFSPSCSHFARDAVNRAGLLRGMLMAADRLLRCHPFAVLYYPRDPLTGRAFDPVTSYLHRDGR